MIKEIINKTNACVVISSTKKNELFDDFKGKLKESEVYKNYFVTILDFGIDIYDVTPCIKTNGLQDREAEIKLY